MLAARAFDQPSNGSAKLLLRTGLVHFATRRGRGADFWPVAAFITITHDGTSEEVVRALLAQDRLHGPWEPPVDVSLPQPNAPDERDFNDRCFPVPPVAPGPPATTDAPTPLRRLFECCRGVPTPSAGRWKCSARPPPLARERSRSAARSSPTAVTPGELWARSGRSPPPLVGGAGRGAGATLMDRGEVQTALRGQRHQMELVFLRVTTPVGDPGMGDPSWHPIRGSSAICCTTLQSSSPRRTRTIRTSRHSTSP